MHAIHDLAATLRRIVKILLPPSDEERAAAYLADAGDLIDLEMRVREIDRGRLHATGP